MTIVGATKGLKKREFSSVELTQACLARAKERNALINAFITISEESALAEAREADHRIAAGMAHALTGIPFGVKDAICVNGIRSTGSARILDNYIPPLDATVVRKIRELGGVILGKNNCDAFGHGASNENSMYGPVRNPHDETKVAGGSSGGSAAAVADNECIYAIAEDTGGSIRQPASFCGIVGLRPSYGRNSRYGIMPMASSLDTVGPIAKSVDDIAILMETMAGQDPLDATTAGDGAPAYAKEPKRGRTAGLRLGAPKEYMELSGMESETKELVEKAIARLAEAGCEVIEISLPHTRYAIAVYYTIVPAEDSSNLARLDGMRYGVRVGADDLFDTYAISRSRGFPPEVKRRILMGTYVLSAGYYDAYYRQAQRARTLIIQDFDKAFEQVDALVAPTSPFPAFGIGEKVNDVLAMYAADVFVAPAAVAGVPALSAPIGKTGAGLPVGLQIIGPRMGEAAVLRTGKLVESFYHDS